MKSWEKQEGGQVTKEPLAWEAGALVIEDIGSRGALMGIASYTQCDTGCREQGVEQPRWADVTVGAINDVALKFAPLERDGGGTGETTKGGVEQGAVILCPFLARWFATGKDKHDSGDKVFEFSMSSYRREWGKTLTKYGLEGLGGPHRCRHTAAVHWLQDLVCSFDRAQARARWKDTTSVVNRESAETGCGRSQENGSSSGTWLEPRAAPGRTPRWVPLEARAWPGRHSALIRGPSP